MKQNIHYTVADGFELLAKKTELPLSEYMDIASSQAEIESQLLQALPPFSTELNGSFCRKTLTSPVSDTSIDMSVLFKQTLSKRFSPLQLLNELFVTLKKIYPQTVQSKLLMAVIVPVDAFQFKLQPGFIITDHNYLTPAPVSNYWIEYNTAAYRDSLLKADACHKGRLIPVIRMLKTWNRLSGNMFAGYYLELLVTEMLADYTINNYAEAIHFIFKRSVTNITFKKNDPANPEILVEGLLDIEDLINAMLCISGASKLAEEALKHEQQGETIAAFKCWRKLFPGYFPTDIDLVINQLRKQGIEGEQALKLMLGV